MTVSAQAGDRPPFVLRFWRWAFRRAGVLLRKPALHRLVVLANRGHTAAAQAIGQACGQVAAPDLTAAIQTIQHPRAIDALWDVWQRSRQPGLLAALQALAAPARAPAETRLYSLLMIGGKHGAISEPNLIPILIQACTDPAPEVAQAALRALGGLKAAAAVDALCAIWAETRTVWLAEIIIRSAYTPSPSSEARILTLLLRERYDEALNANPESIPQLVQACRDPDALLQARALKCLPNLRKPSAIQALCALWKDTRDPLAEKAILDAQYLPQQPDETRLLVALLLGRAEIAAALPPKVNRALIACYRDANPRVQRACRAALALVPPETQEVICRGFTEFASPVALEICQEFGFVPRDASLRAAYLFLSGNLDEYSHFDYDTSILQVVYQTGQPGLRKRIADAIRASGRPEFLSILTGRDLKLAVPHADGQAVETMLQVLSQNGESSRLWKLVGEVPLRYTGRILADLRRMHFQPENQQDTETFTALSGLFPTADFELPALPIAMPVARVRVSGRINEMAFHPARPLLAIATGQKKVVIWNYVEARIERIIGPVAHSIGQIAYQHDGDLFFAERSSAARDCAVYRWSDGRLTPLGRHAGDVVAVEALARDGLLTAGKDQRLMLWSGREYALERSSPIPFWPRALRVAPDEGHVVCLEYAAASIAIPDLRMSEIQYLRKRTRQAKKSTATCAAFTPDGSALLAGCYNGQVHLYTRRGAPLPQAWNHLQFDSLVRGIHFSSRQDWLVIGEYAGRLHFITWPEMKEIASLGDGRARLTAIHLSPRDDLLATGEDNLACTLWDARPGRINDLLEKPIGALTPADLAQAAAYQKYVNLPERTQACLQAVTLLLRNRFRNDIYIDEASLIQPGEYDIILEN